MPFDAHQEGTLLDDNELRLDLEVSLVLDKDLVGRQHRAKNTDFKETRTASIVGGDVERIYIPNVADAGRPSTRTLEELAGRGTKCIRTGLCGISLPLNVMVMS